MATKTKLGDFCAHVMEGDKSYYVRIGAAFVEPDDRTGEDRISIKVDSLPINQSHWTGWCNIFKPHPGAAHSRRPADDIQDLNDDIPF